MKPLRKTTFLILILTVLFAALSPLDVNAAGNFPATRPAQQSKPSGIQQVATPTPELQTPLSQNTGSGDGLIFIGSIIVLIILAGMIFAVRRRKSSG